MNLGEIFVELGLKDQKFKTGLQENQGLAQGFGSKVSAAMGAAKAGSVAFGTALGALGIAGLVASVDINKGMANVASLMPGNTARVQELKGEIQSLAIETGKSTGDMADGLYQVVSAFGDNADTVKILETNAKAATAGLASTVDSLNLTSAVTKGYGDTSAEAVNKVADMALMTVRLGQTTFPELAASIGTVTPLASGLGVSMEELFGVMATATGVTGGAAEVSTQLRGVLQSLAAPTADMTKLLGEMGYASGEAMMADLGLVGTIDAITAKAKETGQPLQKYIGSIEGMTLAMALSGPQAEALREKIEAMGGAAGATEEAFWEQTEGINALGFALDQAKAVGQVALQKLGDALGNTLKPAMKGIVDAIKDLVTNWDAIIGKIDPAIWAAVGGAILGALVPAVWAGVTALWALVAPVLPFIAVGALLGVAIDALVKKFGGWDVMKEKATAALAAVKGAWNDFTAGFKADSMNSMMNAAGTPFGQFGLKVRQTFDDLKAFLADAWTKIKAVMGPVIDQLKESVGKMMESMGPALESLKTAWDQLKPALVAIGAIIGAVVVVAFGRLVGVINGIINAIGPLIRAIGGIVSVVAGVFNLIVGIFTGDGEKIKAAVAGIGQGIVDTFGGLWGAVWGLLSGFVTGVIGFFTSLWDTLVGHSIVPDTIRGIVEWFGKLPALVFGIIQGFVAGVVQKFTALATRVAAVWASVKAAATVAWNAVKTAVLAVWSALVSQVTTRANNIKTNLTNAWNAVKTATSNAWSAVKTTIANLFGSVVTTVSNIGSKIKSTFTGIINQAKSWGRNLIQMFIDGIKAKLGAVAAAAAQVASKVKGLLGFSSPTEEGPGANADKWAPNLVKMYAQGIKDTMPKLADQVNAMAAVLQPRVTPVMAAGGGTTSRSLTLAPGAIVIQGANDPEATAEAVMRKLHRLGVI